MIRRNRLLPIPRWLLPLLVLFLVFGHVCELPAYADLAISSHLTSDGHQHAADHHTGTSQISCEAVDILSNTGHVQVGPSLDVAEALPPVASPVPARFVASSLDDSKRLPSRPPLFLLYASLLI